MSVPSTSEISVVVQGPIVGGGITEECLASIRKFLPRAEIILSTWAGSSVSGLSYDRLVENQDPGPLWIPNPFLKTVQVNNINRQAVSTRGGLQAATRPLALKFRTDFRLRGTGFLKYFDQFQKRGPNYRLFEKRLLACTHYARNPRHDKGRCLFHPGDFVFYGLTTDLLKLWDLNPAAYQAENLTAAERMMLKPEQQTAVTRLTVEQCLWVGCLAKHFPDITLPAFWHTDATLLEKSEETIANNLVLLHPDQWQVQWKREHSPNGIIAGMLTYSHADWRALYCRYCDPTARPPLRIVSRIKAKLLPFVKRCEATVKFRRPVRFVFGWLSRWFVHWKF